MFGHGYSLDTSKILDLADSFSQFVVDKEYKICVMAVNFGHIGKDIMDVK